MGASQMKKQLRIGILSTLALGLLCAMGLAFVDIPWRTACPHRHAVKHFVPPEGDIPGHPTPPPEKMECQPNIQLSDIQRYELATVFQEINEAYTNCQVEVLRKRMAHVPDYFYHVSQKDFLELNGLLYAETFFPNYLHEDKQPLSTLIEAGDKVGFENYVHVCFEAARFVGGFSIRRGTYAGDLRRIESKLLLRLQMLKKYFHKNGNERFEKSTDRLIAEWHEQIESPQGLTRQYALHVVDSFLIARKLEPEQYRMSNKWILEEGRAQVMSLIRLGYTPKWLDEEFSLPPENKKDIDSMK